MFKSYYGIQGFILNFFLWGEFFLIPYDSVGIGHREGRVQVLEFGRRGGGGGNAGMSCFVHCYSSEVYFQKHLNF